MSIEILHQRYLNIANSSLSFLKKEGFKKSGHRYSKRKGEFIFEISSRVPRPWINSETSYEFELSCEIYTEDSNYVNIYTYIEDEKKITKAPLIWSIILLDNYKTHIPYLHSDDEESVDVYLIEYFQLKITNEILPLFERIISIDNVIDVAEKEFMMERHQRKYFRAAIRRNLCLLYAAKGLKEKTLEMCDKDIENAFETNKNSAIKEKKKYIKYFEEKGL